jgi:FkbM family methyltransferase
MILTSNLQRPNIRGCVDQVVSRFGVSGWAADDQMPERTVVVLFNVDDEVVGNKFRSDLADAGIGSGHHAFSCVFPTPIDSASLKRLRLSADGQDLPLHPAAGTEGDRLFVLPTGLSTGEYLDAGWQGRDFSEYGEQGHILRFFAENPQAPRYCVDLGAYDGVISSQSRALLLRGWSGVLVEPDPRTFARLAVLYSDRPDVTCVRCAISDEPGVAHMYFTAGPPETEPGVAWQFAQVNTLTDFLAEHYSSSFDYKFERHPVPVATLTGLLDWVHAPADIGFLSIDCNGVDLRVVRALDITRCRPWLIAVECDDNTRPGFEATLAPDGYRLYAATRANTLFCYGNVLRKI